MDKIESRSTKTRKCKCGLGHNTEIIYGIFHYAEENYVGYTASLTEHDGEKHLWVGFITGAWEGVENPSCCILIHLYIVEDNLQMDIGHGDYMPFTNEEIFDSEVITRDQVLAQPGAKEWLIETYQSLLSADIKLWEYLTNENA